MPRKKKKNDSGVKLNPGERLSSGGCKSRQSVHIYVKKNNNSIDTLLSWVAFLSPLRMTLFTNKRVHFVSNEHMNLFKQMQYVRPGWCCFFCFVLFCFRTEQVTAYASRALLP